jgi:hypothetical protein
MYNAILQPFVFLLSNVTLKFCLRNPYNNARGINALLVCLINHQPTVLFSQHKPAPDISHQPNEQAGSYILLVIDICVYITQLAQQPCNEDSDRYNYV